MTFLGLRFLIILINFFSGTQSQLAATDLRHDDFISILIPARNEARNITSLLNAIAEQDYANFEVIVLDDHSTDGTFELSSKFKLTKGTIRTITGKPLPKGWLGKNFACHQLAMAAKGKYLLFIDADVLIKNNLLNSAMTQLKKNNLDLLSLFPFQQTLSTGEKLTVPLMYYLLLSLLPIPLIRRSQMPAFSAATGQCMLFRARDYKKRQWHKKVRKEVADDLMIMREVKSAGFKGQSLMAGGLITCRMYSSYWEAIDGFSKNFLEVFGRSLVLFGGFIVLLISGPVIALISGRFTLLVCEIVMIISGRAMINKLTGKKLTEDQILLPFQMVTLIVLFVKILQNRINGVIHWKDRPVVVSAIR